MNKTLTDHTEIKGWGADLDPANRPAVPKERKPPRLDVPWNEPEPQYIDREVLLSVEHLHMPAVFGTGPVPKGLSGMIRRIAYKRSENDIRHWLMLLLADRVDMVEGILEDLMHGHIPNVFAEMGWNAKFKYDRTAAIRKTAILSLLAVGTVYYLQRKRRSKTRGASGRFQK